MSSSVLDSCHHPLSDLTFLRLLTTTTDPHHTSVASGPVHNRRPQLDPLILKTAALSSPCQTRNHYLHEYFPHSHSDRPPVSISKITTQQSKILPFLNHQPSTSIKDPSLHHIVQSNPLQESIHRLRNSLNVKTSKSDLITRTSTSSNWVTVQCQARTRIPTTYGDIWLHLYSNDSDDREHLAFVIDPSSTQKPRIKSKSLNKVWTQNETELDRIIRGAEINQHQIPGDLQSQVTHDRTIDQIPIVRIHSECFTGEIMGSRRCDCGEQLDRSIEYIFKNSPQQGVIIYLKQEGRGIGLRNKIKAYNLQDLGFDTIESNQLLGFDEDLRDYTISSLICQDLGLSKIRLMTNNPKKVKSFENTSHDYNNDLGRLGPHRPIEVVERISMIPYQWEHQIQSISNPKSQRSEQEFEESQNWDSKKIVHDSQELETYLRTKVIKMNHLIPIPYSIQSSQTSPITPPTTI